MAFEFSGKLPREQQPMSPALSSMERLEKMITERLKNMEASTKHSLFAGIMALAGVAMPPFIANSQKDESPALHNVTTLLKSFDEFEKGSNRTPYRDVDNYHLIALAAERYNPSKSLEEVFEEAGRKDYAEIKSDAEKQCRIVQGELNSRSTFSYPGKSEGQRFDQKLVITRSQWKVQSSMLQQHLDFHLRPGLTPDFTINGKQ